MNATGSFYGNTNKQEGFNLKNGAEFYLGITEMLQAMDNTVDPCSDFCEYQGRSWASVQSIYQSRCQLDVGATA